MGPTKEQHQILCKSRKCATETLTVIRQTFNKESMGCKWKVKTHQDQKKVRDEEQSQECAHNFL
jgi:hypothetical protein